MLLCGSSRRGRGQGWVDFCTERRRLHPLKRDGERTRALRAPDPCPQGPDRRTSRSGQPTARQPSDRSAWRRRAVPPARLAVVAGVPATVHHRREGGVTLA